MRICHIINPVSSPKAEDLRVAQPIAFESLRRARTYCEGKVRVRLVTAQFPEDRLTPGGPAVEGFEPTQDLDRSATDIGGFEGPKRLPLVRDILDRLYDATEEGDYLVYTNVDIGVRPEFYREISALISQGHRSFVISRRTLSEHYTSVSQLDEMVRDEGLPHPGHDCFVFPREDYPRYDLGDICLGAEWADRPLFWSLAEHSRPFAEFREKLLTFHVGNDEGWRDRRFCSYTALNEAEVRQVLQRLCERNGDLWRCPHLWPYVRTSAVHFGFGPRESRTGALGKRMFGHVKGALRRLADL